MMRYLTEQEVIAINVAVIKKYSPGEILGVKDSALLNSAVNRPMQSAFLDEMYPTVFEKAGALFESLVKNHVFYNGNKRTAFMSLSVFLRYNEYRLEVSTEEAVNFTVGVATNDYTFNDIVGFIRSHAVLMNG